MENPVSNEEVLKGKEVPIAEIPTHIIRFALSQNPFFYYSNLTHYFPHLNSIMDFIESKDYLGELKITFRGTHDRLKEITHFDYLQALNGLLQTIETEIKGNSTDYEGSEFIKKYVHQVFTDKEIRVRKGDEREDGQESLVANEPWYVYNANFGTSEEKSFIELFARKFESLQQRFEDIYILRNERELAIYDKQGRRFEPDFLLFCKQKEENIAYQVFIEPKGKHLIAHDKWKEEFLNEIAEDKKLIEIHSDKYLLTAVPFYNYSNENEFARALENVLNE